MDALEEYRNRKVDEYIDSLEYGLSTDEIREKMRKFTDEVIRDMSIHLTHGK